MPKSAKALVFSGQGRLLVLRKNTGLYDLPGGKVERGERLQEALERECREETGLNILPGALLVSQVKRKPALGPRMVLVFTASLVGGTEAVSLSDEHSWGAFMRPQEALKLALAPPYLAAIARVLGGRAPLAARRRLY